MFQNVTIKPMEFVRYLQSYRVNTANEKIETEDISLPRPYLTGEDMTYLKLRGGYTGILEHHMEQGMDYDMFLFYDLDNINDQGYFEYSGQHTLSSGGYIEVYTPTGECLLKTKIVYDVGNDYISCRLPPEDFTERCFGLKHEWFYHSYPAIWIPA